MVNAPLTPHAPHEPEPWVREQHALLRQYGRAQVQCSQLVRAQAAEIAQLQAERIRLRAAVVVRDTALAWAQEERRSLEAAIPGLPRRRQLARRLEDLISRTQDLLRERLGREPDRALPRAADLAPATAPDSLQSADVQTLEASILAADLVNRTGFLGGSYT